MYKPLYLLRLLSLLIMLICCNTYLSAQTYAGKSLNRAYHCTFHINPDSSIVFIYEDFRGCAYGEHEGSIHQLNDSTFQVNCDLTFGQFISMSLNDVTTCILIEEPARSQLDSIKITYSNKSTKTFSTKEGQFHFCFPADKRQVSVITNHRNKITGKGNVFIIPSGSDATFVAANKVEFQVVIKNNKLKSLANRQLQPGYFQLEKQEIKKK